MHFRNNAINIWRTDTYTAIGSLRSPVDDRKYPASLVAHPHLPLLAAPSEKPLHVSVLRFDSHTVADAVPERSTTYRAKAKVVFVGESDVGKSSLATRLIDGVYKPEQTTHGIQVRSVAALKLRPDWPHDEWGTRDLIFWDMGGQRNYQLIHQLFLHDTTLAVVLFDPTRRDVAYHDVEAWVNRLERQLRGGNSAKILVATKQEHDLGLIVQSDIDGLRERLGFTRFLTTSAKADLGIRELAGAILESIDWSKLERITRPELFQIIRDKIESLRARGDVVVFVDDLVEQLEREFPDKVLDYRGRTDIGAVNVVVTQLSLQGIIAETKISDAGRALVLDLGQIERYAGSLIVAAENNPREIPAIDEFSIGSLHEYPGLDAGSRLPRRQEKVVLEAVVHMLLQNGICLRHEGMLLFPGKFLAMLEGDSNTDLDSVLEYFDFVGAVENIYASLVASLANGKRFGRVRLKPGTAEFVGAGDAMFTVACWDISSEVRKGRI